MRTNLLLAARSHAQGHVDKYRANIENLLNNPAGVGEHGDIIQTITDEMEKMDKYKSIVELINTEFPVNQNKMIND